MSAAEQRQFSFELYYRIGILPRAHVTKSGDAVAYDQLSDQHLYLAWKKAFQYAHGTPAYMALQREKERRTVGAPVPLPPEQPLKAPTCQRCWRLMVLRELKFGWAWGCQNYLVCKQPLIPEPEVARRLSIERDLRDERREARRVAPDPPPLLTTREREIALEAATGRGNRAIAKKLGIKYGTVLVHVQRILKKTNTDSRTGMVVELLKRGVLRLAEVEVVCDREA